MQAIDPQFNLQANDTDSASLFIEGNWTEGQSAPEFAALVLELADSNLNRLTAVGSNLAAWDSVLLAFLLQCHNYCREHGIEFCSREFPEGVGRLLNVATSVPPHQPPDEKGESRWSAFRPGQLFASFSQGLREFLEFIGDATIALGRLVSGKATTRWTDFSQFCYQAGPDAFAIISLTSVLVGMILGYLGAVQLQQFGAEIYVRGPCGDRHVARNGCTDDSGRHGRAHRRCVRGTTGHHADQ